MTDLKALEALIGRRLTPDEVEEMRRTADRALDRQKLNVQFAASLAAFRMANPAGVSPR